MRITFTGKEFVVSDRLKEQVEGKLEKLEKYLHEDAECRVFFEETRLGKLCEITIFLKGGTVIRAEEEEEDVYTAIDRVVEALDRQLRKHKTRLMKRYQGTDTIRFEEMEDHEEEKEARIVKSKSFGLKPMLPEEASLQMELLGHNFFVFLNGDTDQVNVIYKRKDGNYGLIEPYF